MAGVLIDGGSVLFDGGSVVTFGGEAAAPAGADPALGGFRSLYGFWLGGAGVAPTTPSGGPRSLLAPWLGGAGANTRTAGFRSPLAFWLGGGASSGAVITVTPPAASTEPTQAGGKIIATRAPQNGGQAYSRAKLEGFLAEIEAARAAERRVEAKAQEKRVRRKPREAIARAVAGAYAVLVAAERAETADAAALAGVQRLASAFSALAAEGVATAALLARAQQIEDATVALTRFLAEVERQQLQQARWAEEEMARQRFQVDEEDAITALILLN